MPSPYRGPSGLTSLPELWAFTDPQRTPDVTAFAAGLPAGTGLVYRHFGKADRGVEAQILAGLARSEGLTLLIAADIALAEAVGAHGVHWPERLLAQGAQARLRYTHLVMTAATHSYLAVDRAWQAGMDAAFLSPLLPSNSPSATHPLGLWRARSIVGQSRLPVYGLGGLDMKKAKQMKQLGLSGMAMIEAWLER